MEPEIPRGQDVIVPFEVTLEELYNGNIINLVRSKMTPVTTGGFRECNCRHEMKTIQQGHGRFSMVQERVIKHKFFLG